MKLFIDKSFIFILLTFMVACGADEHKETNKFEASTAEMLDENQESEDANQASGSNSEENSAAESEENTDSKNEEGICIIIKFNKEGKSFEEIAEYIDENYKDKTHEELANMLHECNTPADLMIILLIKSGMKVKEAVAKVMELTDCSIQLVIKVLKEHLLMPTAEIIKVLFELGKYTKEQIVDILKAAIEAKILIKAIVVEELLVYLHAIGEPLLKAVEIALHIAANSIQLVVKVLHERLLVPTAEIIVVLFDLGKFTAEQIAEILRAAVEAGVLVSEVVIREFLTVLHAVGEPIVNMIRCALMIAEDSIELILTVLKDGLLMPGAEIARALVELGLFTSSQVVKLLLGVLGLGVDTIIEVFKAVGATADSIRDIIRAILENN